MFDGLLNWFIGGAATLGMGLIAWLGAKNAWRERRERRGRDARLDAEKQLVETALRKLRETQKPSPDPPPARPGRRDDFEKAE